MGSVAKTLLCRSGVTFVMRFCIEKYQLPCASIVSDSASSPAFGSNFSTVLMGSATHTCAARPSMHSECNNLFWKYDTLPLADCLWLTSQRRDYVTFPPRVATTGFEPGARLVV